MNAPIPRPARSSWRFRLPRPPRRVRQVAAVAVTAAFVALFWFTDWFGPGVGANLTFSVNSTADTGDNNPGNGVCSTGGTISGGAVQCTLRAAIQEANTVAGLDTINFAIPTTDANHASGVWTISPASGNPLPTIYSPVTIDGTTQSGTTVNSAVSPSNMTGNLAIQISGVNDTTTADWDGLVLNTGSDGSTIRGLSIHAFDNSASDALLIWNSSNNVIAGNYIGVKATGTVGNDGNNAGIGIAGGSSNNRIGGTAAADRNMCSANTVSNNEWTCVWAAGSTTLNNTVQGNELGIMKNGTATGGGWSGVSVWEGATVTVGGTATGAGNRITGFAKGIILDDVVPAPHAAIVGNRIWSNTYLAIDLLDDDTTANDANDADSGPNDLLNFPVISSVKVAGTTATVAFSLDVPAGSYYIEAFTNPSGADGSGYGEAQITAGSTTITKTGTGSQSYSMTYTGAVGDVVSLTATQLASGNPYQTSELSLTATAVNRLVTVNSTHTTDDNNAGNGICSTGGTNSAGATACTLRAAVTEANASAAIDTIWFAMPTTETGYDVTAGVWTISPAAGTSPPISTTMTIDATTQTGWTSTPVVSFNAAGLGSGPAVSITGSGVVLKGLNVRGSPGVGISVAGANATISYCFVGTNAAGTAASANAAQGVTISASGVTLDHNLISGNGADGIIVGAADAIIVDNYIGTTVTGNAALANGQEGIELTNGTNTVIGTTGHGNVISGNSSAGINGWSGTNTGVKIQGNKIGVGADGTTAVGNGAGNTEGGITLRGTNTSWLIGGTAAGEGNTIANNTGDGVMLVTVNGTSNDIAVLGNSIYANTGLGIDLADNGVTVNDSGDADSGSNDLLNQPMIREIGLSAGSLTVTYRVDAPAGTYRTEFYTNTSADPTGYGEAQTFAGSASITHPGGAATYTASFAGAANAIVTASLTENPTPTTWGATSELSQAVTAGVTVSGTVYEDVDGDGAVSDDGAARSGVDVWLFAEKDANSKPSAGDVLVDSTVTDGAGAYSLMSPTGTTVYVVVDSQDVIPSTGFAGGFSAGSAWAEQTYGPAGSATYNGTTWSYAGSAGSLFGGARPASSDGFPALSDADHIARQVLSTSSVAGLDWGFSFVPVVRTYDAVPPTGFTSASSWSTFDAGTNGVGTDPDGYTGAVFDGRYIYYAPYSNGTASHGEVLRYDTQATFASTGAWSTFDPGANGVGTDPDGFVGAVFDGRYVYFVPYYNGVDNHGEVLRYDTTASFTSAASWSTYDAGNNGVGTDPDGFVGAVFDGRYVYFVPYYNGVDNHGEVLRYDTTASFTTAGSWASYDPGANGVGSDPDGFAGAVFDGRFVYFMPYFNGTAAHGEVLRYDTTATFAAATSWATYDPGANGVGSDADGYAFGAFDGRYVYFSPFDNGTAKHGEVLRYDTASTFAAASSWSAYDPGANGVGTDADGYTSAVYDGRYVYFTPTDNGTSYHGEVLRYDTTAAFSTAGSWSTFDAGTNAVGTDPDGYYGAVYDGRYVYFSPFDNGGAAHGEVLRYDTGHTGQGTLRRFLSNAAATVGTQTTNFEIPTTDPGYSGGLWTITPASALDLNSAAAVDATTQTGWNGSPLVAVNGTGYSNPFTVSGTDATVSGLRVTGAAQNGIKITGTRATITSCYLGSNIGAGVSIATGAGNGSKLTGNTITANTGDGVEVVAGTDHTITGNVITSNGGNAIDLGANGTTANDANDNDAGANDLLNTPALSAASESLGLVDLTFSVDVPAGTYRIEVYTDPSNNKSLTELVGSQRFTTTAGSHTFATTFAGAVGDRLVATLTEDDGTTTGSTSEVSATSVVVATGGATAADSSIRRSDLRATGGLTLPGSTTGRAGKAIDLGGGTHRLVGPATDLTSAALTISGWVKLDTFGTDPRLVAKASGATNRTYELLVDSTTHEAVARIVTGSGTAEVRGGSLATGTWYHLAVTWDGTTARLYVDGAQVSTTSATGTLATDLTMPLVVGNVAAADRGLDGLVDQIQVAHTARSAAWLATAQANMASPSVFVTVGGPQTEAASSWATTSASAHGGTHALAAPNVGGNATGAWITADGLSLPGVEFESWWRVSDPSSVTVAAGTRTGLAPANQYEAGLTAAGFDLASLIGGTRTLGAAGTGTGPTANTWTKVVISTDETGSTRLSVGGTPVRGPVTLTGGPTSGSVGLRAGALQSPYTWYIDDIQLRKLVSDEPDTTLAPIDRT